MEKWNGCEGGTRWNLLELSRVFEKIDRVADGRSDASFRSGSQHCSILYTTVVEYLSHHVTACQPFGSQVIVVVEYSVVL
jgi:hypothetical protein